MLENLSTKLAVLNLSSLPYLSIRLFIYEFFLFSSFLNFLSHCQYYFRVPQVENRCTKCTYVQIVQYPNQIEPFEIDLHVVSSSNSLF